MADLRFSGGTFATVALLVLSFDAHAQDDAYGDDTYDDDPTSRPSRPGDADADHDEPDDDSLSAGGLAAPDALGDTHDDGSDIEQELEEADRRDSGRGLEFAWLHGEFGMQHLDLAGLGDDNLAPGATVSGTGITYGGALGVRVLYFTLGGRFRMANLGEFDVLSVAVELGMKFPLGNFEPYGVLGLGYLTTTSMQVPGLSEGASTREISGVDLRLGAGADYYLSDFVSVGAQVGGDFTFTARSAYGDDSGLPADSDLLRDGSGTGAGLTLTAIVGFHF